MKNLANLGVTETLEGLNNKLFSAKELIEELNAFVDIFLCETVSSIAETSNILKAVKNKAKQDKKIWLSWTLLEDKNCRLRSKETIEDAFKVAESFKP